MTHTAPLPVGACGIEAGVGLAAETWQQELSPGVSRSVTEGSCPLIIGQWGLHFSAADMCHQHDVSADIGIANSVIASATATSLSRHITSFYKNTTNGALRSCDASHNRLSSRSPE